MTTLSKAVESIQDIPAEHLLADRAYDSNPILEQAGQISFADIIIDSDGFARRALFSLEKDNEVKEAFGTSLAFIYLSPEPIDFNLENK